MWINISSIALIVLGLIHLTAVFKVGPMFENLNGQQFNVFIFMYLATGLGTVLPGLISKLQVKGLKEKDKRAWITLFICSVYAIVTGIGAVILMNTNPFAYLEFIIGILLLTPVLLIKNKI